MGPARPKDQFQVGVGVETLDDPIGGESLPAPFNYGHALSISRVAADGLVNLPAFSLDHPEDNRPVALPYRPAGELAGQGEVGGVALGGD